MHRIVPELIIENYRAGRHLGTFKAASLFLDISGFSGMTDALMGQGRDGAEALAVTMRGVFDPLVEAIFAQGGMIVGYAGDSISALYPIENDELAAARRALASAHAIQSGLTANPSFETPFGSFRISAKIGLGLGRVAWGILPSREGDRAMYYFRGEAVNQASLAEHAACAGDIMLTDAIRVPLGAEVETKPIADCHVLHQIKSQFPGPRPITMPEIDTATAAAFAPREVITQDLRGEFRQTTQVFLRIPDLPEAELERFAYTFLDLQNRYGGFTDRMDFGDKGCNLAVVWGAPVAHENDIDRALGFMLDLRSSVRFPVTAGITYYISHAGYVGGKLFETYAAYGWGMNLAARLATNAADGDIWVDERIRHRIEQRFHSEFVGEHNFKGFAQKQKVFVLRGRRSGVEMLFRGKLIGRQAELTVLDQFVAPLWSGRYAGALGLWGEAGIGKSRLVYEFRRSSTFKGRTCLWAHCQADEILRPAFNPFRYWLQKYFGTTPGQDQAARSRQFSQKLDEVIASVERNSLEGELKRGRGFLAALVDVEWNDPAYAQMDAQGRYDNTILALIALLKAESRRQPVVLFLEDAQYMDEESRAFVPRLKRALAAEPMSYPIAILMAARLQDARGLLEDSPADREIDLRGLNDESVAVMAQHFLGQPAAAPLVKLVNARAEGNPFFVEQILRYLQEQDLIEISPPGEWVVKPAAAASALPADVSAMLVARLDKLATRVKNVVQAASVLGRVFELSVLGRMMAAEGSLQNELAAAEHAAIWSPLGETRYIFNHALLRDVAYGMQLQSRRQQLHKLAFEALKDLFGGEAARHYGEMAFHCEQAALAPEAAHYLSLAGDAARDEYQNAQALDYYRRALAVLPRDDLTGQYGLHREREKILAEHGGLEERTREIETLQSLAEQTGERGHLAEVKLLRSRLENSRGEYERAEALAREAEGLASEAERYDIAIEARTSLLVALYQRGMYKEAVAQGEAAIALARQHKALQQEAFILNWLGLAFLEMKNPSTARSYFEQALAIFQAQHNVRGMARVLTQFGTVAGYQGNYTSALDYYEQALRLAKEIGARKGECALLGNTGWISGLLGNYQQAREYAQRNLDIARETGDPYNETVSLINLSSYAGAMGESAAAIEYAEEGLTKARETNDRTWQAWALTYLGHGLFESGLLEPAAKAYSEALDVRSQLDQPVLATEPAAGLARLNWMRGDRVSALQRIESILAQLEQDGTLEGTDQPLRVYLSCYLVLSGMDDPRARGILNTARDMIRTRANGIADPSARQVFLENIAYNREIMSLWEKRRQSVG